MTTPTADDAAKGARHWHQQVKAGWAEFARTVGDDNLQAVLDRISFYQRAAQASYALGFYHPAPEATS